MNQPSVHGGQVYEFARQQQLTADELFPQLLDFSASINPIPPHIDWQTLQTKTQLRLTHYPDQTGTELKQALSRRFNLPPAFISLNHGISATIHELFARLRPSTTLLLTPIYGEYFKAAQLYSQRTLEVSLNDYAPEQLAELDVFQQLPTNSVVVLVNPSTPQGQFIAPERFDKILTQIKQRQAWCIVDESFLPFMGFDNADSFRSRLAQFDHLLILQSLTKYYACPGARIGCAFTRSDTLQSMIKNVWPVSSFDEQFMLQALADEQHDHRTQQWFTSAKIEFIEDLKRLKIVDTVYKGVANFVLVKFNQPVTTLQAMLAKQSILIRSCESFGYDAYHARLAIRTSQDNRRLIKVLQTIAGQAC